MGCGTGLLTVSLVRPDRRVVGIDPSTTMLTYAAGRPGSNEGDLNTRRLPEHPRRTM
ncbi:class I SAM-dependent methyltransferase [Cellulomonas sp.]|uniref:class I SAM-dependent methyltransferase n=1 Tax=Cellulomonas sp. TaxID=40001 RepID=UPI003BA9BD9F